MTETATETVDQNEATPFVEDDREIAYRSEATPQVSHGPAGRPAVVAPSAATGRRKEAVARVRLVPGSGQWTINGRTLDDYFPNKLHQQLVSEPFAAAAVTQPLRRHGPNSRRRRDWSGRSFATWHCARAQRRRCRSEPTRTQEGRFADP